MAIDVTYVCLKPPSVDKTLYTLCFAGQKDQSHGKIAYTFKLAAKTQKFCPAVCARIMLWFSSDVRGHIVYRQSHDIGP